MVNVTYNSSTDPSGLLVAYISGYRSVHVLPSGVISHVRIGQARAELTEARRKAQACQEELARYEEATAFHLLCDATAVSSATEGAAHASPAHSATLNAVVRAAGNDPAQRTSGSTGCVAGGRSVVATRAPRVRTEISSWGHSVFLGGCHAKVGTPCRLRPAVGGRREF